MSCKHVLTAACFVFAATPSFSYTSVQQWAGVSASPALPEQVFEGFSEQGYPVENAYEEIGALHRIFMYSKAEPGVLMSSGAAQVASTNTQPEYQSHASLGAAVNWGFYFSTNVRDESLSGSIAKVSFNLFIQGGDAVVYYNPTPSLGSGVSGGISSYSKIAVGSAQFEQWYEQTSADGHGETSRQAYAQGNSSDGISGTYVVEVPVYLGVSNFLEISLRGAVSALAANGGEGHASFERRVYWGGVRGLEVGGKALQSFEISTSDGIDLRRSFYASPVPEPTGCTLALVVLATFACVARSAKSSH